MIMKDFDNDEKNEYQLYKKEKVNDTTMKTDSKGSIAYEGEYVSITYQRRLPHARETIWKEITDPKQLSGWMNTKAIINGRSGGTINFVNSFWIPYIGRYSSLAA